MQKAVLYARVSSKEQEREGFSIPAQIKLLKEYALKNNFKIVEEFIEAETAKKAGRKEFSSMIKFLKKNKSVNTILVEKTDRLYRNLKDYVSLDEFDGLEVHLVKENEVLSENSKSHQKLIHGIKVLLAKNTIDNLSEEVKKGHKEKCEQGYYPGKAPVGYLNVGEKSGKRIIVPDEALAPFVRQAFELYITGCYSFKTLASKLASEGFLVNNKPCTKSNIESIFDNPFYCGDFMWNGKLYTEGKHEAIISKELYYSVQKQRDRNGSPKKIKHEFAYTNLIKCSKCGCYLTADIKKGKYVYYFCTGNRGGSCKKNYLKQEVIDELISELLQRLYVSTEEIQSILSAIREMFLLQNEYEENSIEKIEKQIKTTKKRLQKLYLDKLDGIIDEEFYLETRNVWQEELDKLKMKHDATLDCDRTFIANAELVLKICNDAYSLFLNQSAEEKRKLLNLLCSNFSYDGENLHIELNSTFKPMLKSAICLTTLEQAGRVRTIAEYFFKNSTSSETLFTVEKAKNFRIAA